MSDKSDSVGEVPASSAGRGTVRAVTCRNIGFWLFIASNILWIVWGVHSEAYALIVLQVCLAAMNIRGARKTDQPEATGTL